MICEPFVISVALYPRWGTADAKIKVPFAECPELSDVLSSILCVACWQKLYLTLTLPSWFIQLQFSSSHLQTWSFMYSWTGNQTFTFDLINFIFPTVLLTHCSWLSRYQVIPEFLTWWQCHLLTIVSIPLSLLALWQCCSALTLTGYTSTNIPGWSF